MGFMWPWDLPGDKLFLAKTIMVDLVWSRMFRNDFISKSCNAFGMLIMVCMGKVGDH